MGMHTATWKQTERREVSTSSTMQEQTRIRSQAQGNDTVKMATVRTRTGHPYPYSPDQNLTRRVIRTCRRVENSFHTRIRRVTRTQQYT